MVSRTYNYPPPPSHPHEGARYLSSRLCAPYSYSERRYLPSHDARAITMAEPQSDDNTPPRKRIAVACGRCRKRKIRCSGDPGGGMPCVNCKNAGVDQCLFLRVQSHETAMRDDNRYEYNMDVSRTLAQRGAGSMTHMGASSMPQYPQEMPLLSSAGMPTSYRGSGYPTVSAKGYYYSMAADLTDAYGAADGSVDYGLSCPPYQVIGSDPVQMPVAASSYGNWPTTTRPKSTTQGAGGGGGGSSGGGVVGGGGGGGGGGGLYLDSDAGYGAYGTATNASLVHRPAVSVASESPYSFSGFAASLPSAGAASSSSSERLLPTPVSRAAAAAAAASSAYRSVDGSSLPANPSCYGSSSSSGHSPSVVSGATGIKGSPTSPLSEVTGYASSAYDYATTTATGAGARSSQQQQQQQQQHHHHHHHHGGGVSSVADVYASVTSNDGGPETIFGDADRSAGTQGPAVDLSGYTYGAPSPADTSSLRRASSGSGLTSRSTAESSNSSYAGSQGGPPPSLGQQGTTTGGAYHPSSSSSHGHVHHQHQHQYQHQQQHGGHPHHHQQHAHHQQQQQYHASAQQQQQQQQHHHNSPRHGSHHMSDQRMVAGSTAYGAGSTGSNGAGSGIGGGAMGNTTAAADSSRRPSVATRR